MNLPQVILTTLAASAAIRARIVGIVQDANLRVDFSR